MRAWRLSDGKWVVGRVEEVKSLGGKVEMSEEGGGFCTWQAFVSRLIVRPL